VAFSAEPESSNIFGFFGRVLPADRVAELKRQLAVLPVHPFWLVLAGGTLAGLTINGVAGLGEELGWRGFLQSEWRALGFWKSSWLIGLIWGVWHTPFILHGYNYPGHPVAGVFMMTLWTILFAPLIGYVRLRSGSVFAAAMMHGAINGTAIAPAIVVRGGDSLTVGVFGWPGILILVMLNAALRWFMAREERHRITAPL
jgi:membrane protease YdiL (CAAX protease family)